MREPVAVGVTDAERLMVGDADAVTDVDGVAVEVNEIEAVQDGDTLIVGLTLVVDVSWYKYHSSIAIASCGYTPILFARPMSLHRQSLCNSQQGQHTDGGTHL